VRGKYKIVKKVFKTTGPGIQQSRNIEPASVLNISGKIYTNGNIGLWCYTQNMHEKNICSLFYRLVQTGTRSRNSFAYDAKHIKIFGKGKMSPVSIKNGSGGSRTNWQRQVGDPCRLTGLIILFFDFFSFKTSCCLSF
jgi:hypothetical protein